MLNHQIHILGLEAGLKPKEVNLQDRRRRTMEWERGGEVGRGKEKEGRGRRRRTVGQRREEEGERERGGEREGEEILLALAMKIF